MVAWFAAAALALAQADGGTPSAAQRLDELEARVEDLQQRQQAAEEAAERANADLAAMEQQRLAAEEARGQRLATAGGALAGMRELAALLEAGSYEVSAPLSAAYAQLEAVARSAEQNGTAPEAEHARSGQRALDALAEALGRGDFQAAKIALAVAADQARQAAAATGAHRAAGASQPP